MKKLFTVALLFLSSPVFAQVGDLPANYVMASPSGGTGKLSPRAFSFSNLAQVDGSHAMGTAANTAVYWTFNNRGYVGYDGTGTLLQSALGKPVRIMVNVTSFGAGTLAATFNTDGSVSFGDGVIAGTHFRNASAVPTASACGVSPTVTTNSTNSSGQVTTGTGLPTSCTMTFANAYPTAAFCTINAANAAAAGAAVLPYISASSASAFTVALAAGTDNAAFNYVCIGK